MGHSDKEWLKQIIRTTYNVDNDSFFEKDQTMLKEYPDDTTVHEICLNHICLKITPDAMVAIHDIAYELREARLTQLGG